jgi:hypothetical protein
MKKSPCRVGLDAAEACHRAQDTPVVQADSRALEPEGTISRRRAVADGTSSISGDLGGRTRSDVDVVAVG